MMTLKEFQATKRATTEPSDLADITGFEELDDGVVEILVYVESAYISVMDDGQYHLILFNEEWIDKDVAELEPRLYQFCIDNGVI